MTEREDYLVHTTRSDADLAAVCDVVYDAIASRVDVAHVDAFSDFQEQMPDDILRVEAWLRQLSAEQTSEGSGMGIKISPTDEPGWVFARAYTPWSIRVEVYDSEKKRIAAFHDCGYSIIVSLNSDDVAGIANKLPPGHEVERLIQKP